MTTITVQYQSQLRCSLEHQGNHKIITTDAPLDNNGKGESFSPTDLLASGLISCMITVMGIAAQKRKIAFNAHGDAHKEMTNNPRRIQRVSGTITISKVDSDADRKILQDKALNCPVALSLHPSLQQEINFIWL